MTMAHFSRNHSKPFIKGNNLALPHQRGNGKRSGLIRFAQDPSITSLSRTSFGMTIWYFGETVTVLISIGLPSHASLIDARKEFRLCFGTDRTILWS